MNWTPGQTRVRARSDRNYTVEDLASPLGHVMAWAPDAVHRMPLIPIGPARATVDEAIQDAESHAAGAPING